LLQSKRASVCIGVICGIDRGIVTCKQMKTNTSTSDLTYSF